MRFAYRSWGSGPLVLLFHGFPDTADTWDVIGPAIAAQGFRVVAPFQRGIAPTAIPERDTVTRTLGEDALALIEALGEKTACLVGHDWGAETVYAAAGLKPDRVEKLVTVSIPCRLAIPRGPSALWHGRHFFALKLPGAVKRLQADNFAMVDMLCRRWSPTWKFTADDLASVKRAYAQPGCADAAIGYYRALSFLTPDFMRGPYPMPSLAITGAQDPAVTVADFEKGRRCYASTYKIVEIPGGHFCHRESPEPFIKAVVDFLKGR